MSAATKTAEKPADQFASPPVNTRLLYRVYEEESGGDPLTPEERAELDAHVKAREDAETRRSRLGLVNLAAVMRDGVTEPEMLVPDRIVRSDHHLVYGTKESGKTWAVLEAAARLIGEGETVVWVDKEMGRRNLADRLKALGANEDDVDARFVYLEHPSMDAGADSLRYWVTLLEAREPALVVFDAQTELLADAGLNENSGTDVAQWSEAYLTPARRVGAATVMIDHTGHTESGRSVGSRQKGAAAKVELCVKRTSDFGRDEIGQVTIEVMKNTVSAPIPAKQTFRVGGKGGKFVFETDDTADNAAAAKAEAKGREIEEAVVAALRENADGLSTNQLDGIVKGRRSDVIAAVKRLAEDELQPVRVEKYGQGLRYVIGEAAPTE